MLRRQPKFDEVFNGRLGSKIALLLLIAATAVGDDAAPALKMGDEVPISSMRVLFGERPGRNTCLAGKNRNRRAISVYASTIDEMGLKELTKTLGDLTAANKELASYILLTKGSQFDEALKNRVQAWANENALDRVEVAVANGLPTKLGLSQTAAITVICANKRKIEFRTEYEAGKLDDKTLAELAETLTRLTKAE